MEMNDWTRKEATRTLARLLPRLEPILKTATAKKLFMARAEREFSRLFALLLRLYGNRYDFYYHLEQVMTTAATMFAERSGALKKLDKKREADPLWFQSEAMVGGVCYVDLFAGNIEAMHDKIPYFKELGLTYLHLMPLFNSPPDNSDGGYAISDYRTVHPSLGTMKQLAKFAAAVRDEGISLVLDFVFNHTSNEHVWAKKAISGDERFQDFYWMFPDRTIPDQYEATLREIFPEQAPGNFTYRHDIKKWVWTSFYDFQWDLNYANPDVFNAMLGEMLFLANQGVEVLRLDAVAFIWKRMGTTSENQPEAHWIIQALNALVKMAAPAMIFKSEAIVHPDDVVSYISWDESPLSYNPTLMALLWEAIATRDVTLLQHSMSKRYWLPERCTWVNYVRVHDDIGWTFADEDAAEIGINGFDHRQFLNKFYIGTFDGSFSTGLPFGVNPRTMDMRIAGMGASLVGIEQALKLDDELLYEMAVKRFLLLYSVIMSVGGIPLIYLGDEIATLNDYSFTDDTNKKDDSRWVHRPKFDWQRADFRRDDEAVAGRVFMGIERLITLRKATPALGDTASTFFSVGNRHVLAFVRGGQMIFLGNFSEVRQSVDHRQLSPYLAGQMPVHDMISEKAIHVNQPIELAPYQSMWLDLRDE